jgi:hypothetical protein
MLEALVQRILLAVAAVQVLLVLLVGLLVAQVAQEQHPQLLARL